MKIGYATWALILGTIGTALCIFVFLGFFLDDLQLSPFFGLRGESTQPVHREKHVQYPGYGVMDVKFAVTQQGNGIGVEVVIRDQHKKVLLTVGGNEATYIGFKDIDGDGQLDVLVRSLSHWPDQGTWLFRNGQFIKTVDAPTKKARFILFLAGIVLHSRILVVAVVLSGLYGIFFWRKALKTVAPVPPQNSSSSEK